MDVVLVVLAGILLLLAVIGCFLPVLPGPPLGYAGILLLHISSYAQFSTLFLISLGAVVLVVSLIDYLVPILGAKRFGGSKMGVIGCLVGLVIGIFVLPPIGIVVGPFLGAIAGELINGDDLKKAIKSGFGSFIGYLFGTGVKLAVCLIMVYFYVARLIQ
ncbi:MAG: membrane protein [Cyclobacteriaceae bacterium]|nr:MAG: membrane protein [Cyclobacteriaceae bacterium]